MKIIMLNSCGQDTSKSYLEQGWLGMQPQNGFLHPAQEIRLAWGGGGGNIVIHTQNILPKFLKKKF
jgi:hypothetical protein